MKNFEKVPGLYPEGEQEDLDNEEVVSRILEGDDKDKIEKLRVYYNFSEEKISLCQHFAKLRKKTIQEMRRALEKRVLEYPELSKEEEGLCCYNEEIEPHVLNAVTLMRKKGYDTYESGFGGLNNQRIGVDDNSMVGVELPVDVLDFAKNNKVEIELVPDGIWLYCNRNMDIGELKEIWDKIAEALPDLGRSIDVDEDSLKSFRWRIENMKANPDRFFD